MLQHSPMYKLLNFSYKIQLQFHFRGLTPPEFMTELLIHFRVLTPPEFMTELLIHFRGLTPLEFMTKLLNLVLYLKKDFDCTCFR